MGCLDADQEEDQHEEDSVASVAGAAARRWRCPSTVNSATATVTPATLKSSSSELPSDSSSSMAPESPCVSFHEAGKFLAF